MNYAGFWLRVLACIIDGLLILVAFVVVSFLFGFLLRAFGMRGEMLDRVAVNLIEGVVRLVLLLGFLGYFALMESSKWQATVGKLILGLTVTDMEGRQLSFNRALGRNLAKIISGLILYIGYLMAGFTEKKQALHDMIAGCLVIRAR